MSQKAAAMPENDRPDLSLVLFQPDIAANTGTLLRLAACLGISVDIIEPAGFPVSDRAFRRAGLDYLDLVKIARHVSFAQFEAGRKAGGRRLILLSTKAERSYLDCAFAPGDRLMLGRETAGVPDEVQLASDIAVRIPMQPGLRSLNVAVAGAMVLGEALRQIGGFFVAPRAVRADESSSTGAGRHGA